MLVEVPKYFGAFKVPLGKCIAFFKMLLEVPKYFGALKSVLLEKFSK